MFNNPNNQINTINNLKSLAGSIAHETRNPLAGIKGACELIKDNMDQISQMIDLMYSSSNRGLFIIDMILNNIRDNNIAKDNFVNLSISKTVKIAIEEFVFQDDNDRDLVNLDLDDDNDFTFFGDETMMIFVIFNLLKNALHYKSKIEIRTEIKSNGNYLYLKDYGPGIKSDKLELIFESFFTSDKKDGTGLGLPFCRRIMKAFDGDIICRSEYGKYCEFEMRFVELSTIICK